MICTVCQLQWGPWCILAALCKQQCTNFLLWLKLVGCLRGHSSHGTKWDTSGFSLASLLPISLAPMVLPKMCRGLSAVHCLIPSQVASSLQAKAHSSSPGSPLTSHTLAHRGRGQCRPSPTHATPSTAVVVGEDMVDHHLRINIMAMVRFDHMYSN